MSLCKMLAARARRSTRNARCAFTIIETTSIAMKLLAAGECSAKKSAMRKASVRLAMTMAFLSCEAGDDSSHETELPSYGHSCRAGMQSCATPSESLPVPVLASSVCTQTCEEPEDRSWEVTGQFTRPFQSQCQNTICAYGGE